MARRQGGAFDARPPTRDGPLKHDSDKPKRRKKTRRKPAPLREGAIENYQARGGRRRRSTCYSPELHEEICRYIEAGASYEDACMAAGISDDTLRNWHQWGADGEEPFRTLVEDIRIARAQGRVAAHKTIYQARLHDWRAAKARLDNDPENPARRSSGTLETNADELAQAFRRAQRAVEESVPLEPPEPRLEPSP
jgi:hypothetical protein